MLMVRIELYSAVDGRVEELGRMYLANDGKGTESSSTYDVAVCRKGVPGIPENIGGFEAAARTGRVLDYSRKSYNVWRLISRALLAAFPEEQKIKAGKTPTTMTPEVMSGLKKLATIADDRTSGEFVGDELAAIDWLNAGVDQQEPE
jgi:hypothetical protein